MGNPTVIQMCIASLAASAIAAMGLLGSLGLLVTLAVQLYLAYIVYQDAQKTKRNGILWAVLCVLFAWIAGLIYYFTGKNK